VRVWERAVAVAVHAAAAAAVVAVVLGLLLARENSRDAAELVGANLASSVVLVPGFALAAVLVLRGDPRHVLGWVFLAEALLNAGTVLGVEWGTYALVTRPGALPLGGLAAWIGAHAWWPALLLLAGVIPLLYPDGRLPSPRWRPVGAVAVAATAVATAAGLVSQTLMPDAFPGRRNPTGIDAVPDDVLARIAGTGLAVTFVCGLAATASIAVRLRRADGDERGRLAWFLAALLLLIAASTLPVGPWAALAAVAFLPVALGVAMARHGLYDGDRLLNRTLVYGSLTVLVVAVFGTAGGLAGTAVVGDATGAVVAAVIVALGLSPARDVVQRGVDRLLYGQRRDPYGALTGLGRRLNDVIAAEEVLPAVARTVSTSLRLPYAAVHLGEDPLPAAAHGSPAGATVSLPLRHATADVGRLVVGLGAGQRRLDPADERLLRDFAAQIGVAAHAARLTADLRQSHDRLAAARDAERHRIRRDLHDGLGPMLAGLALGLGAARRSVTRGDPGSTALLGHLQEELRQCLEDVRRLVAEMRPTPLEQVGLLEALRAHADSLTARADAALQVTISTSGEPPPAGTELVVYRIAMEAMTNVARHAGARHCDVEVSTCDGSVRVVVRDDGVGLDPRSTPSGFGLRSMRERAQELGGSFSVGPGESGGTVVTATLPRGRPA
jgi:signal transduction histidine kinase